MMTSSGRARRRGNNSPDAAQGGSTSAPGDVVTSSFANVDLRVARAALEEYTKRCDVMSRENAELRAQLQERDTDSVQVVRHLENKLQQAKSSMAEQSSEIQRLLAESAETESAMRLQYESMLDERDEQIAQYSSLTQRLQAELRACTHYVQGRERHILEVQRLHDELEDATARHETELATLRLQTIERKMRLITLEEMMQESFKDQVEAESARLLEAKSQALLEDHKALQLERERLTKDIEELVQLTTMKNTECADARRKGVLHQHACEEAMRRIVHGNRRMRESGIKMQRIEQRLKALLHEKQSQREEISQKYEAKIDVLEKTLAETRRSLEWHRTELRRMRHIATTVVGQRSDLEQFFYVALNDVRRMRNSASQRSKTPVVPAVQATLSSLPSVSLVESSNAGSSVFREVQQSPDRHQLPAFSESTHSVTRNSTLLAVTPLTTPYLISANTPLPLQPTARTSRLRRPLHSSSRRFRDEHPASRGGDGVTIANNSNNSNCSNLMGVKLGHTGDGAYLSDLSWGDKEKIIKALLFYINQTFYQRPSGGHATSSSPLHGVSTYTTTAAAAATVGSGGADYSDSDNDVNTLRQ